MKRLKQILVTTFVLTVLAVLLTGCGQTVADVKRDAAFTKICTEGGGHVYYPDFGGIACSFYAR